MEKVKINKIKGKMKKPIIISIFTPKGGVGKTTTTLHLSASFSNANKKVLLLDFDNQTNLTQGLGKSNSEYKKNVVDFLNLDNDFEIVQHTKNLYIIKGNKKLSASNFKRDSLKNAIDEIVIQKSFDYVFIDCPPAGITDDISLGEIALIASDFVISPIEAEAYSVDGILTLLDSILEVKQRFNNKLNYLGLFFNKVNIRSKDFKDYYKQISEEASDFSFKTFVRQDININNAKKVGKTIFEISPSSRASLDYANLYKEITKKIKKLS